MHDGTVTENRHRCPFLSNSTYRGNVYDIITSTASKAPIGSKGTVFLPWLAGAACPHYDDNARGGFIGMTLGTTKAELTRAAMEGICFEMREMLEAPEATALGAAMIAAVGAGIYKDMKEAFPAIYQYQNKYY